MDLSLLTYIGKCMLYSLISIFGINEVTLYNTTNSIKNVNLDMQIVQYRTIKNYTNKYSSGTIIEKTNGEDGISYINKNGEVAILKDPINEEILVGTGEVLEYFGIITGYGADCKGCSGTVACKTREKTEHNLINNGQKYIDSEYGELYILAADFDAFPCGTILKVENSRLGTIFGIVLDTGYSMRKAYDEGIYHIDVAFEKESDEEVLKLTDYSGNIKYTMIRKGW